MRICVMCIAFLRSLVEDVAGLYVTYNDQLLTPGPSFLGLLHSRK